jgi:hypothetical protein
MFEKILSDETYIKSLHDNASDVISTERTKLAVLYSVIENFIRDNSFIISKPELLYESKTNLTELNQITIFCENIFRHSNKLINLICTALDSHEKKVVEEYGDDSYNLLESELNPRWLSLRTVVAHEEINLFYDGRPIVIFRGINLYKNIPIFKMLVPMPSKRGIFTEPPLLLLPPELELMDIYHKLYSPDKAEDWEDLLSMEYNLYEIFVKRKPELIGGGAAVDCTKTIISNIETIKRLLVLDFMKNQPLILIGEWALKLIEFGETGKSLRDNFEKVQILIDSPIDDFNELLETFLTNVTPYKCTYREEKLHTVDDGRLKKYTFYISGICTVSGQKTEKPFLDVFNSCRYEIVPYRYSEEFNLSKSSEFPNDVKIGNAYVLLRFMLLDIWILRVIKNLGLLTPTILETKISRILAAMEQIKNIRKLNGFISRVFQHDNYLGTHQSLMLYQKNKLLDSKFPTYVPYYFKQTNGTYRDI